MTRLETWLKAPLARTVIDDEIICSCCMTRRGAHIFRFFESGVGIVCKKCFFHAVRCEVDGCEEPCVYGEAKCRGHYMNETISPRELALNSTLKACSTGVAYPDHRNPYGSGGYSGFRKQIIRAMEKRGYKWRDILWIR